MPSLFGSRLKKNNEKSKVCQTNIGRCAGWCPPWHDTGLYHAVWGHIGIRRVREGGRERERGKKREGSMAFIEMGIPYVILNHGIPIYFCWFWNWQMVSPPPSLSPSSPFAGVVKLPFWINRLNCADNWPIRFDTS